MRADTTIAARRRRTPLLAGIVFVGAGAVLAAVCVLFVVLDNDFRGKAVPADGQVIAVTSKYNRKNHTYAPVVRFSTSDGRTFEFTNKVYRSDKPTVGTKIAVLYDPADPTDARVDDMAGRLVGPVITGGLGTVFLLLGTVVLVFRNRFVGGRLRWRG